MRLRNDGSRSSAVRLMLVQVVKRKMAQCVENVARMGFPLVSGKKAWATGFD
jgi:hypothetical protein